MSESTPQNWPIYNVRLSHDQISKIAECVFPHCRLESVEELEKRKSFNNRIYFLSVRITTGEEQEQEQNREVVLKVIGRFFDARKVQNEVASLLLLAKHCPEIPAPRVIAWSEDGIQIAAIRQGVFAVLSYPSFDERMPTENSQPWIMVSKCAGRILTDEDLAGEYGESIAKQLADIVKSWRQNIPHRQEIGNIKLQPAGYTSVHDLHGLETIVSDSLLCDTQPKEIPRTLQQYYDHLLCDQMHKVRTMKVFGYLRPHILEQLQAFRIESFAQLPCFRESDLLNPKGVSLFTHQDLSPRNILVSRTELGLTITGLVDFEFSGFFAPEEEFLTSLVRQDSDWPRSFADILLEKLESRGVQTPGSTRNTNSIDVLFQLIKMIEQVAPWWLQAEHITGKDLETQLDQARASVEASLERLKTSAETG